MRSRATRRLATVLLRHRALVLIAIAAITALAGAGATRIRADFTFWNLLGSRDGELDRLQEFRSTFGNSTLLVVVLVAHDDVLSGEALSTIDALTRRFEDLEQVDDVVSLTDVDDLVPSPEGFEVRPLIAALPLDEAGRARVDERIRESLLLEGRIVAADRRLTTVTARLVDEVETIESRGPVLERIRAIVAEEARRAAPDGVRLHLAGHPEMEQVMLEMGIGQRNLITGLAMVAVASILFALYRSIWAVIFPSVSMGIVVVWTVGLIGWTGGTLNLLTSIVPSLLVVIGVADALHLMSRYHEEIGAGHERDEALRRTVEHLASACFLTSVTTAIGFASTLVSDLEALQRFGGYTAAGVLLAYVVTVSLTPVLLSFVPAPRHPRRRAGGDDGWDRLFTAIATFTVRRARPVAAVAVALTAGALVAATRVDLQTRALQELHDDHPVVVATRLAEEHLQGVLSFEVDLRVPGGRSVLEPEVLRAMERTQRSLEADPMVTGTWSLVDLLKQMNRALHDDDPAWAAVPDSRELAAQLLLIHSLSGDTDVVDRLVLPDHSRAHVHAHLKDLGNTYFFPLYERQVPEIEGRFEGLAAVGFTGESLIAQLSVRKIVRSLMSSLGLAFVFILGCMTLLFRSFKVGLIAMFPNVLPALGVLAAMTLLGIPLRMATSMICAVALGIAVDDTIHLLVRLRAELPGAGGDYAVAIRRALVGTGRPILFTTLSLSAGFLLMTPASFRAWVDFGILGTVAIVVALVADLFATPAVMVLLHPRMAAGPDGDGEALPPDPGAS